MMREPEADAFGRQVGELPSYTGRGCFGAGSGTQLPLKREGGLRGPVPVKDLALHWHVEDSQLASILFHLLPGRPGSSFSLVTHSCFKALGLPLGPGR